MFSTLRKEVLSRLADLQNVGNLTNGQATAPLASAPPSYEEATQSSLGSMLSPYAHLNNALNELKVETGATSGNVLYVQENVRMYFISPDGQVGSLSDPTALTIAQIQGIILPVLILEPR